VELGHTGKVIFIVFMLFAILARLWVAISGVDTIYPDEHFQIIEPANWVIFGYGWKSWEWFHGVRSWVVPGLYMPLLAFAKLWGYRGGPWVIWLCRIWTVIWTAVAMWQFHLLLKERGLQLFSRVVVFAIFCFSAAMMVWSAATFSESWALIFLWAFMPRVFKELEKENWNGAVTAGVLVGLIYLARIQMLAWGAGFMLMYFATKESRKLLVAFCVGFGIPVLFQGVLDWITWGRPFHSTYMNIKKNIFEGIAAMNGVSPWYNYLPLVARNLGLLLCGTMIATFMAAVITRSLKWQRCDVQIGLGTLVFFVAHSMIGHKETRFLLPVYPAFFYLFAISLDSLWTKIRWAPQASLWISKIRAPLLVLLGALGCVQAIPRVFTWDHYTPYDLSGLSLGVFGDGGLKKDPSRCLLLVDSYWVWTRGFTILRGQVRTRQSPITKLRDEDLYLCKYALVLADRAEDFQRMSLQVAPKSRWQRLQSDRWGNVLFKNYD